MQKLRSLFLALTAVFFIGTFIYASKVSHPIKSVQPEGGADHTRVTLEMLNCKPGLYKTYQDFLDGNPLKYTFLGINFKLTASGRPKEYVPVFKNEKDEMVTLDPKDFWGFTDKNNHLCRSSPFKNNADVKYVCYYVRFATRDFICYVVVRNEKDGANYTNLPYSADLNSPIVDAPTFWTTHSRELTTQVEKEVTHCSNHTKPEKDLNLWEKKIYECYGEIPNFVGYWVANDVRSARGDAPGHYVF